jgi:hypothetical protein
MHWRGKSGRGFLEEQKNLKVFCKSLKKIIDLIFLGVVPWDLYACSGLSILASFLSINFFNSTL